MAIISIETLQGKDKRPIVKEVAIVYYKYANGTREQKLYSFLVKSPYSKSEVPAAIQITNNYITSKFHGIEWEDGDFPCDSIRDTLFSLVGEDYNSFSSKGTENCALLSNILGRKVYNLELHGCPKVKDIDARISDETWRHVGARCDWNHKNMSCALSKCLKYDYWMNVLWLDEH
jgi:hypothetical protein